ncbi:carbohydrate esterase family 16 protein [Aulographum hederae CBS 113979]|uniref:Carbohydrate esterase family 16 protein n=1 Tax=Aulographum hederae CBS 113979 TaxID=1176131 RepID=A0A6G1GQT1_9PEZI|nr:carbohydrate esterase family 16 protein [Aulographum hederae CBS 113979]
MLSLYWCFVVNVLFCAPVSLAASKKPWKLDNFKNLVAFGDSYTDEGRTAYIGAHDGEVPPLGYIQGVSSSTSTGGYIWPRYVSWYTNSTLYNYGVSGAVCSNNITPRSSSIPKAPFKDMATYAVPTFIKDLAYAKSLPQNETNDILECYPDNTVYSLWIGTNDLGNDGFITDSQLPNKTIPDYLDCVYQQIEELYENAGARYFVLMNAAPLHLAPQYALPERGGLPSTDFWGNKGTNLTEISFRMKGQVGLVNEAFGWRTPGERLVEGKWDGLKIAVFDVGALMTDIYTNPTTYLNGTGPPNVTGTSKGSCTGNCTTADPDSYMWYDALHPSEQTSRIVAKEFAKVVRGEGKWGSWWGA